LTNSVKLEPIQSESIKIEQPLVNETSPPVVIKLDIKNTLDATGLLEKGIDLYRSGKYLEAINYYDQILERNGNNVKN